jgi:hypothetical protein
MQMKKFYLLSACLLTLTFAPAAVFADADTIDGTTPTINNASGTGPATVTFTPSPNVELSLYSTTVGYAVTSANVLTNTTNGMEYAAHHEATGYAQRTKTTDAQNGPAAATEVGLAGVPGTDWVWMGGGGS